ncbi:MAG: hypothetical protein EZS28_041668 [Streblomastix strix]|uniref:Uncharacterized protein n=1 Tax=Streblomastix strix TaxID=222440 RepID=A0A5J4TZF5_9EUKA|nr:MAG: hypothetical protein EZS28_041668 [Streblomastix strix]
MANLKDSFTSFAGMIQNNGNDTLNVVVNQGFGFYPMDLGDFKESYLMDPQKQELNENGITSNGLLISHTYSVIKQYDTLPPMPVPSSIFRLYTLTEMS